MIEGVPYNLTGKLVGSGLQAILTLEGMRLSCFKWCQDAILQSFGN